jgi:cell division septation protein DedD
VHFHHEHDDPCEDGHDWPDYVHALLATINRGVTAMTEVQNEINDAVQSIGDSLTAIETEVSNLEAQIAAGNTPDLSGLKALVSRAQGDVPAPVPAPADQPAPAPADGSAAADQPAPADVPAPDPNAPVQPSI